MRIRKGWIPNCSTMAVWLDPVTPNPEQLLKGLSEYFMGRSQKKSPLPRSRRLRGTKQSATSATGVGGCYKVEIYHRYKATSGKSLHLFDFKTVEEFSVEEVDADKLLKRRTQQEATAPREHYISTELAIETEYGSIQYDGNQFEVQVTELGTSPKEDWLTELYPYLRQFERILFSDGYGESENTGYDLVVSFFGNE